MRYLFIDRILRLEANKQIIAIKNVALSDDVFLEHFVGYPVMPGALLIESLAQAGTALLEVSTNFKKKALPVMIDQAKFRALVRPGDQLKITATIVSLDQASAQMDGTIHLAERLVANAKLTFALKEADEFYPAKTRFWVEAVYDFWLKDEKLVGVNEAKESRHV